MKKRNKTLYWILGFVLSFLFLYLSLRGTHFEELKEAFTHMDFRYFVPVFGCLILFYWIKAIRWRFLLTPVKKTKTGELFPSMMTGIALNLLLFGYIGEFARTYVLGKQQNMEKSSIFATIFLERIFDLFTILILAAIAVASSEILGERLMNFKTLGILFLVGVFALAVMVISIIWTDSFLNFLVRATFWLPKTIQQKLINQLEHGIHGFRSLSKLRLVLGILFTSFAMWLFMALAHYLSMVAVGADAPFVASLLIIVLITAGISLPSAPGHIGLIQLCYVLVLQPFGIDASHAFAAAVVYHVALSISIILLGLSSMKLLGMSLREAKENAVDYESEIKR